MGLEREKREGGQMETSVRLLPGLVSKSPIRRSPPIPPFVSSFVSSVRPTHAFVPLMANLPRFAYLQYLLQVGGAGDEGGVAGVLRSAVGGVAVEGVRRRRRRGRGGGRVAVEEF